MALLNPCGRVTYLILWIGAVRLASGQVQAQSVDEYQVKAAFLYNFAKFVEWPPHKGPDDSFVICVLGRSPFGPLLEQAVRGKQIEGRALIVREISEVRDASGCQILYVPASENKRIPAILDKLKTDAVLTVGETQTFAADGGVINLKVEGGKVHLEVNMCAAERVKLHISSKLLSLATIVKDKKQ